MQEYFSDKELGPRSRTIEEISEAAWGGIIGIINSELKKSSFGLDFPLECPDGGATAGNDRDNFSMCLRGEISAIPWPLELTPVPHKFAILDLVQFCYNHIAQAQSHYYHSFFQHDHFNFDRDAGRRTFRESVSRIFSRNGIAFELEESGKIIRLTNPILQTLLSSAIFETGDVTLDSLLEDSRCRFLNRDPVVRGEALEKLWDAWERIKTIEPGKDKKESTKIILDKVSSNQQFRDLLETEALELTRIGNNFRIRHSETNKEEIDDPAHVDYCFHRMFAMIMLLLKKSQSLQ